MRYKSYSITKTFALATRSISPKRILITTLILLILTFLLLALRPLPKASKSNCTSISGIVLQVSQGDGKGDVVIKIENDDNYYYMNRAIDNGYSLPGLKEGLVNKKVELLTIKHWTPLDPGSRTKHIAEIKVDGKLIYSEL